MSTGGGIHHQTTSFSSASESAVRQRPVTDHSVESLLHNSPDSNVDEPSVSLLAHHVDVMTQSAIATAAALLPSTDDALPSRELAEHPVVVRLEHRDLWDRFNALGTEMVITKSGRYRNSDWSSGALCRARWN